ncbi:MAG: hypothetical protein AAF960_08515 [Bacteroidota bacterium]
MPLFWVGRSGVLLAQADLKGIPVVPINHDHIGNWSISEDSQNLPIANSEFQKAKVKGWWRSIKTN